MSMLDRLFDLPDRGNKTAWDFTSLQGVPMQMPGHQMTQSPELKAAFDMLKTGVQGRPQYPDTDIESLQRAYTRSEIVYAAIQAKVTAAIDPRLKVELRTSDGEWEEEPGHPMRRLIMEPNPDMDEAEFVGEALASQDISGWFYAEIVRGSNRLPVSLHPLNPAKMFLVPGEKGRVDYLFKDGNLKIPLKGEDVIAWRKPSPLGKFQALSPLAVCLGAVDADNAQTDFIRAFFNNGGVPSGILKALNRTLNQEQIAALSAQWAAARSRSLGNQQSTAVLDQNMEYTRIGSNLAELQGDSLREFTETRVAMAFKVPPFIIYSFAGIQHNTYSNAEEAWKQFWTSTMTPWFKSWRTFLTRRLLSEFVDKNLVLGERIRLNWDMSQVAALQEDVTAMQNRARENFKVGAITLNELRAIIGEGEDPAGSYYLRAFNLIPVEVGTVAEPEPVEELVPEKHGLTPFQRKALVKAKVGRETISRRIERDIMKLLQRDYEAVAKSVEAA